MPKLTNKCKQCGKPIVKAMEVCPQCRAKLEAAEQEIHESRVRLIPELLWEKRRYEIAKETAASIMGKMTEGEYSNPKKVAQMAIRIADALIVELKNT